MTLLLWMVGGALALFLLAVLAWWIQVERMTRGNWFEEAITQRDAQLEHDAFGTYWEYPLTHGEQVALWLVLALVVGCVVAYVG